MHRLLRVSQSYFLEFRRGARRTSPKGKWFSNRFTIALFSLAPPLVYADPYELTSREEIRSDLTITWSDFSTVHQTSLPADDFTNVPTSEGVANGAVFPQGGTAEIWDAPHYFTPGILLRHNGPGTLFLYPPREVQGFGVVVEHTFGVAATYTLDFFRSDGTLLFSTSGDSPGTQGNPLFLGMIDPEARIGIIGVSASPGNTFAIADPIFQLKPTPPPGLADLPADSAVTVQVSQAETYLHEGYLGPKATPATDQATADNENAHDLLEHFPSLRPGDLLRLNRLGVGLDDEGKLNPLLGVFSATNAIERGSDFNRVPGGIGGGTSYYTGSAKGLGTIETPTNIASDFVIGPETHVTVRDGVRYLFLSRAQPGAGGNPVRLRISHIRRTVFLDWLAHYGLFGPNADLQSDLDGDGFDLLAEFAFRKDPTVPDSGERADYSFSPIIDSSQSASLRLLFGGRRDVPLRYVGEFSSDMTNWVDSDRPVPVLSDGVVEANSVFFLSDPAPSPGPRRFGRVRIEYIPPSSN